MKALLVDDSTRQLYEGDVDMPEVGPDDLLVKVKATAVNRADLLQKRGLYPPPKGASPVLGLECAGTIEKLGANVDCYSYKQGDRICALLPGGGYAQYVAVPAKMAMRVPDNLSIEEAAAIPEVFLTAYLAVVYYGKLKPSQTALIHAGASGVGTAAIQIVNELGAQAIVTTSKEKQPACLKLGASAAYDRGNFRKQVEEFTARRGVDLIIDPVGAAYWEDNLSLLATDGKLILLATMGGRKAPSTDLAVLLTKRLQIIATTLRHRPLEEKILFTRAFWEFAEERFTNGRFRPVIDSIYEWHEANSAHQRMEANLNIGKIVIRVP
ncbi:MAG: NAD(P)H-quinone oxidoreductase [Acidobacteriota bacterium]|nr:NAD(P)H-quinone oxidoreductase [Blastocatellia bacterium]MDW8412042.1 NAD(P)H-quinone oxidoreductase [Acidobacteriota bacterium]